MTTEHVLAVNTTLAIFKSTVNKGDVEHYQIDCSPWAEDNGDVVSVAASIVTGSASIGNESLSSNVWQADITFTERRFTKISLLIVTATNKKKIYLNIKVNDPENEPCGDDYGQEC